MFQIRLKELENHQNSLNGELAESPTEQLPGEEEQTSNEYQYPSSLSDIAGQDSNNSEQQSHSAIVTSECVAYHSTLIRTENEAEDSAYSVVYDVP